MTTAIVISNTTIGQDEHGRYCLNHLHRAAGGNRKHNPSSWMRSDTAQALVAELEKERCSEVSNGGLHRNVQAPCSEVRRPLNIVNDGKSNGTFAVKELVYAYAMWISPKFHLHVIRAFDEKGVSSIHTPTPAMWGKMSALYEQLGERDSQIISMLEHQQQAMQALNLNLSGQVTKLAHQVERLSGKVISTQGQLIRSQKHITVLTEGRMGGAQASETILQMTRDGHSNAQIVAATGRNLNHVRQAQFQARKDGTLPPLPVVLDTQAALFTEAA